MFLTSPLIEQALALIETWPTRVNQCKGDTSTVTSDAPVILEKNRRQCWLTNSPSFDPDEGCVQRERDSPSAFLCGLLFPSGTPGRYSGCDSIPCVAPCSRDSEAVGFLDWVLEAKRVTSSCGIFGSPIPYSE